MFLGIGKYKVGFWNTRQDSEKKTQEETRVRGDQEDTQR